MFVSKSGVGALHWQRMPDGSDWTEKVYVLGGHEQVSVGKLGTPRRSRDAARKTAPVARAFLEH